MDQIIDNLDSILENLTSQLGNVIGQYNLLQDQIQKSEQQIQKDEQLKLHSTKAVELLNMTQKVTRNVVCNAFETLVSQALQYIFESDQYKFQLEFGRRGNLQELNFTVKKPNIEEVLDPMDTSGGGVMDIISLTLRVVLMEVSQPKIEGPLILDESLKHLSSDYLSNAYKFLEEMNQKTNRQIILITHQQSIIENAQNLIEIK